MTHQHRSSFPLRTLAALLVASCFGAAYAVPSTPLVVKGQATFAQNGNVFTITNAPNTVINWQSFSINAGEVTRFIQQSSDSAVLNRIVGQDPSQIMGALQSNGHVFLINPNGILFGRDSRVDVNGLTASTLGMADADFLAGKQRFGGGAKAGAIVNQGAITTPSGGRVFLIASSVDNAGIITSPQGQVVLAAGHSVQLVDSSNLSLQVVVSAPADRAVNLGQVIAQGGKVGIYGALVSQRGVVNANSAQMGANGKIVLRASGDAMLEAGSVTSATGVGRGGDVSVEGVRVGMLGDARIDASGAAGGGSVLLGGGYQGKNALLKNAQQTLMGKNATIRADAIDSGNGGTVVLWSDASTRAIGTISARGGALNGNGGLVETSGKFLDVNGIAVQAGARNGANGTWLLDPFDIEVTDALGTATLGDVDWFGDLTGTLARINASTISTVAPGTNVVLQAENDVTFSQGVNPALGGTGSLQVDAGNNIFVNAPINTNGGALRLTANHAAFPHATGSVIVGAAGALNTGGGSANLNGFNVLLGGPVNTGDGNTTINAASQVKFDQNIATGNGHLTVTGSDIAFGGTGTTATGGFMLFNNTGGTFTLGPNWTLDSFNEIHVHADSMSLLGTVGLAQLARPRIRLMTYTPGRPIDITASGTSTTASTGLALDPAALQRLDVEAIHIGNPDYTGNISVLSAYTGGKTSNLTLQTQGNIAVNAPISMPTGIESALLLSVTGSNPKGIITTAPDSAGTAVVPGGRLVADYIDLQANNMSIGAPIQAGGAAGNGYVSFAPHRATGQIAIGAGALDGFDMLGLLDTELKMVSAQGLRIGGNDGQMGGLTVTAAGMDFSSILNGESDLMLEGGMGNLVLNGSLIAPVWLFLGGRDVQSGKDASATARGVRFHSQFGIGNSVTPFVTRTSYLSVSNESPGGLAPINIANTGELSIESIHQNGVGNQGSITISNVGGLTLHEFDFESEFASSIFTGGQGNITLKTLSPLTINGDIKTQSGAILLEAGNGGVLTIGPSANVTSVAGNIALVGGALVNDGAVLATAGNINISAPAVSGLGSFSAPGGLVTGLPPKVPGVGECLANGALPGCTDVLKVALDACVITPTGPNCLALLPSLAVCTGAPQTYGCSVVLPTLTVCIATPNAAGCSAVLPTLALCTATPATEGCGVVLPTLTVCIATPNAAGCSAVLPTFAICSATPSTKGCGVVLPTLTVCIATPNAAGCSAVLPTLAVCAATPSSEGCSVVLPTLKVCIATPNATGCSAVLPTLSFCTATPGTEGCAVVLPTLAQCTDSPSLQGCTAVLPTLTACAAKPQTAGCGAVLQPVTATPDSKLEEAINVTIAALDNASDKVLVADSSDKEEKKDDSASAGAEVQPGEKPNEIAKNYCN